MRALHILAACGLVVLPAVAVAATNTANTSVVPPVGQAILATAPTQLNGSWTDPSGQVTETVLWGPQPSVSWQALAAAQGASSGTADFSYGYTILGPSLPSSIVLDVVSRYSLQSPSTTGGYTGVQVTQSVGTGSFAETVGLGLPNNCLGNQCAGTLMGQFTAFAPGSGTAPLAGFVDLKVNVGAQGTNTLGAVGTASINAYLQIDPSWAATHPGYQLAFEPGISNLAPVPEPSSWMMLLAGLGTLALTVRRRGVPPIAPGLSRRH